MSIAIVRTHVEANDYQPCVRQGIDGGFGLIDRPLHFTVGVRHRTGGNVMRQGRQVAG